MNAKEIIEAGLYAQAVEFMDDEIREQLHADLAPCSEEEFLEAYMEAHENKYGVPFSI